jgi:hypothetical protein
MKNIDRNFKSKIELIPPDKLLLPSEFKSYSDAIASITKTEFTETVKGLIEQAIAEGKDIEQFKKELRQMILKKGWQPTQGKNKAQEKKLFDIIDTHVRQAHREARIKETSDPEITRIMKWKIWVHGDSPNFRPHHKALHMKAIPSDHRFWAIASPSCAFGCRCRFFLATDSMLKNIGATILTRIPDPYTIAEEGFRGDEYKSMWEKHQSIIDQGIEKRSGIIKEKLKQEIKNA